MNRDFILILCGWLDIVMWFTIQITFYSSNACCLKVTLWPFAFGVLLFGYDLNSGRWGWEMMSLWGSSQVILLVFQQAFVRDCATRMRAQIWWQHLLTCLPSTSCLCVAKLGGSLIIILWKNRNVGSDMSSHIKPPRTNSIQAFDVCCGFISIAVSGWLALTKGYSCIDISILPF